MIKHDLQIMSNCCTMGFRYSETHCTVYCTISPPINNRVFLQTNSIDVLFCDCSLMHVCSSVS